MKFREHRGSLHESMETAIDIADDGAPLAEHIAGLDLPGIGLVTADRLDIDPYSGDDARIGWRNMRLVSVMGWGPVGFVGETEWCTG